MEKSGTVEENRTAPDSRRQRLLSIMPKLDREINGTLRFALKFFRQSGPPPVKVPSNPRAGSSGILPLPEDSPSCFALPPEHPERACSVAG